MTGFGMRSPRSRLVTVMGVAVAVATGLIFIAGCVTSADGASTPPTSLPPLVATGDPTATNDSLATSDVEPTDTASAASIETAATTSVPASTSSAPAETSSTVAFEPVSYDALRAAGAALGDDNLAVSISVWRGGTRDFSFTSGARGDGRAVGPDTPFVIASVSKLVTALSIARLVEEGRIDLFDPVPWDDMGVQHDAAWEATTVRQLLAHTSGIPEVRKSWLDDPGPCSIPLQQAMAAPPTTTRGRWKYSNGNYCALGLLVEHLTGMDLDDAAYDLVFRPAGITGPYLSVDGLHASSVPYPKGLARLERLGGAGTWLASTDDIAAMLAAVTADDRVTLEWPGIIVDQYGWGHTGTLDGAEACAWLLQDSRTVITAFVSGSKPNTGGKVCDRVVPALATDLGIDAGDPVRNPD